MRNTRIPLALITLLASAGLYPSDAATAQSASRGATVISVDRMAPDMRAAYLKSIRAELRAHGYGAAASGNIGRKDLGDAIRRYQRDAGLTVDGMASKELLDHLMFALPKVYAGHRRHRAGTPPEIAALPAEPAAPRARSNGGLMPGFEGLPRDPVIARTLPSPAKPQARPPQRAGGSGVVTQLQRHLAARGYYRGKIDGVFDDEFGAAVRKYQRDNNLPVTGVIDSALLNAILPQTRTLE